MIFSTNKMSMRIPQRIFPLCILICALLMSVVSAAFADQAADETKIGQKAAEEIAADKKTKFVEDPAILKRVQTIGEAIAKVANSQEVPAGYGKSTVLKFDYCFKVLDDKDVNAFCLPGGFIYINKGLLDNVHSDDELAGVVAHEVAHAAHHHAMQLMASQNKQLLGVTAALLAGAISGIDSGDLLGLASIGNLIVTAKTSAYGQKAEFDADRTAVAYMSSTKYNPVGLLTFMERLAHVESHKPEINYGIYMNHPLSRLRAREMIDEMSRRGLPINRRLVTTYTKVHVKQVESSSASSVWIGNTEVIRLVDAGGRKASDRADAIAEQLTTALIAGAKYRDVKVENGGQSVSIAGRIIVSPTSADAVLAESTIFQVTTSAANRIRQALISERLEQTY